MFVLWASPGARLQSKGEDRVKRAEQRAESKAEMGDWKEGANEEKREREEEKERARGSVYEWWLCVSGWVE